MASKSDFEQTKNKLKCLLGGMLSLRRKVVPEPSGLDPLVQNLQVSLSLLDELENPHSPSDLEPLSVYTSSAAEQIKGLEKSLQVLFRKSPPAPPGYISRSAYYYVRRVQNSLDFAPGDIISIEQMRNLIQTGAWSITIY